MEEAEHLRHKQEVIEIYSRRKETIERVFAGTKEKHGIRWTTLRRNIADAGDAYFLCLESEKDNHLDMKRFGR